MVPVATYGDRLAVAMANPMDVEAIDAVQRFTKKRVEPLLASASRIQKSLDQIFGHMDGEDILATIEEAIGDVQIYSADNEKNDDIEEQRRLSGQAPVLDRQPRTTRSDQSARERYSFRAQSYLCGSSISHRSRHCSPFEKPKADSSGCYKPHQDHGGTRYLPKTHSPGWQS